MSGRETVLDLYCGVGTFALSLSPDAGEVLGVERAEAAVDSARRNAYANGVNNARFVAHDLDGGLPSALSVIQPDVVIVDPPRAGLHANTVQTIRELAPARIVSVSCHPVPQAENLLALCADGSYYIAETQPVDLFPHTPHVENVALLIRSRG
ncbi:class I SAM-dependent RNA methyltransferase [Candidatus Poribacteria bacterium]|nr:class I SAM-dependent RNA methyltransferase [Candidatus Poribacteria bacterium]